MILRLKPSPRQYATLGGSTAAMTVPAWLRRAIPDVQSLARKDVEEVVLTAGATIGAFDAVVRRQERWAGAWRQRLALSAAAVTAKQAGRVEDEGALRDAVLLTRPGDFLSVGPAGLLLIAWRRLAARPGDELLTEKNLAAVLEEFGYAPDDEVVSDLTDDLRQLAAIDGTVGMMIGAIVSAERHGYGRAVGAWLADAWAHAVPLLGAEAVLGTSARPR
ncbi:ribosomal protein L12E/L44/L45/RPP1/RPP2 [Mesorhizobium robiniae]|uniref:Ribosomal protein L12E/L44/L45/RPP1/RPP2 n=1 Tax=Mesorhizobium robiniae TaxID=559315 RepID=A0ABV2GXE1_9HYPH